MVAKYAYTGSLKAVCLVVHLSRSFTYFLMVWRDPSGPFQLAKIKGHSRCQKAVTSCSPDMLEPCSEH